MKAHPHSLNQIISICSTSEGYYHSVSLPSNNWYSNIQNLHMHFFFSLLLWIENDIRKNNDCHAKTNLLRNYFNEHSDWCTGQLKLKFHTKQDDDQSFIAILYETFLKGLRSFLLDEKGYSMDFELTNGIIRDKIPREKQMKNLFKSVIERYFWITNMISNEKSYQ